MPFSTEDRALILSTPLGEDNLLVQSFEGREHLSQLYDYRLEMLSDEPDIAAADLVGKRVTLRIETADDQRYWNGIVSHFTRTGTKRVGGAGAGESRDMTIYHATVVPWLWQLGLNEDSRIFHNKSIPDIVHALFSEFKFSDHEDKLTKTYPTLDYVTQYRETTLNFICRLLERAGIFFYFLQGEKTEKLVLVDTNDGCVSLNPARIKFSQQPENEDDDVVTALSRSELIRSGRTSVTDYDFENPAAQLESSVNSLVHIGENANFERFIHPGSYTKPADGANLARILMEAEEASHATRIGKSNVRLFNTGCTFELFEHPDHTLDKKYLLTSVEHHGRNNLDSEGGGANYGNSFTMVPATVAWRAPMATPRARIYGPQTGIVIGPAGEEISTDKYGRVKVLLPWDRAGNFTCWARVMQASAGNGWGTFFLPRIGMEVVVTFEDGNPDHPLVIGTLYNGKNALPYPDEPTKSTLKTNSSKGGGGFNELRFEDKKGEEEVFLHAEKKLQIRVKENASATISGQRDVIVEKDSLELVKQDRHLKVTQNRHASIQGNDNLDVTGKLSVESKQDVGMKAGMALHAEAGMDMQFKAGMKLVLDAGMMMSLKAGSGSITLGPAGVTIDGALVKINCGGSASSASSPNAPQAAKAAGEAIKVDPGKHVDPAQKRQATAMKQASQSAQPFCAVCPAE